MITKSGKNRLEKNRLVGTRPQGHPRFGPRHGHAHLFSILALQRFAETGEGDIRKLRGVSGDMRLRVGDYRVRFTEEPAGTLRIHAVLNRKEAYR